MRKCINIIGIISVIVFFTGCIGQPSISNINETEAFKYDKKYLEEYNSIKEKFKGFELPAKWLQAVNKKEECKIWTIYNPNNDETLKAGYKIFWDGKCKNGYAYGLGREFVKSPSIDIETIAIYSGEKKEPKHYIQNDKLKNVSLEGNLNSGDYVKKEIQNDISNFDIRYQYGHFPRTPIEIKMVTISSPFVEHVSYGMEYPNFSYTIKKAQPSNNSKIVQTYKTYAHKPLRVNGFISAKFENGRYISFENINGNNKRQVALPYSYYNRFDKVINEIMISGQKAINEQRKALNVKSDYKKSICNKNIFVKFIDKYEYKDICNEDENLKLLKEKTVKKLAQIGNKKEAIRIQKMEERLIKAKEVEANAAMRNAKASEQANFNQSMENISNRFQMRQLNNNLMMYNLMPKIHNVYIH